MANNNFKVAVIEQSEIIRLGLLEIVNRDSRFSVVLSNTSLPQHSDAGVGVVIVNPSVASISTIKELYPSARLIALLYNYYEQSLLRQYDDSIELSDSAVRVLEVLERNSVEREDRVGVVGDADELSEREREILVAVAKGMLNKEIADQFNISIHTVVAHRKNIQRKTGIRSVSGLVVYALLNNLITETEILK